MDKSRAIIGEYAVDLYAADDRVYYTVALNATGELFSVGNQPTQAEALAQAEWAIQQFGRWKSGTE